jgi:hypothetical protein
MDDVRTPRYLGQRGDVRSLGVAFRSLLGARRVPPAGIAVAGTRRDPRAGYLSAIFGQIVSAVLM